MITAKATAKYIIKFFHESEDLITNLKLQKLLYYVQGWHLGLYDKPLFEEDFQAWVHGPVQPAIYGEYKHYRWNPISEDVSDVQIPDEAKSHIDEVLGTYGVESAYMLERRTHQESPWLDARGTLSHEKDCTNIIPKDSMRSYFAKLANEKEA